MLNSALHVSGDVFAHHLEHLTVFTVSGSIHPNCCRLVSWMNWNCSSNSSNTPAGSNLGEYYRILQIQSSAPDDGRKHRPKYVELTRNNKFIRIVASCWFFFFISVLRVYIRKRRAAASNLITADSKSRQDEAKRSYLNETRPFQQAKHVRRCGAASDPCSNMSLPIRVSTFYTK